MGEAIAKPNERCFCPEEMLGFAIASPNLLFNLILLDFLLKLMGARDDHANADGSQLKKKAEPRSTAFFALLNSRIDSAPETACFPGRRPLPEGF